MYHTSLLLVAVLFGVSIVYTSAQSFNISVDPEDATICKGQNATLNCGYFFINVPMNLVSTPLWEINETSVRRNSIDSDPNDLLQWIVDGDNTNTTRLLVGPVDERFVGRTTFQCMIPTGTEPQSQIATLIVIGTPPTPTITVIDTGMTTITISWTIPEYDPDNVCESVMYRVTISGLDFNDMDTTSTDMHEFTELTPNTIYTITVTPHNDAGDGPPTSTVLMTMPTEPSPPTDVSLSLRFISGIPDITASWIAPQLETTMTRIEQYSLALFVNGLLRATTDIPANTTMVDIFTVFGPNITRERYTNYSLSVAAINSAGIGVFRESDVLITNYIQNASATPEVGMIIISCRLAESVPRVICSANPDCLVGVFLTLPNDVPGIFGTDQPCNITFQATTEAGVVVEERIFTNVKPTDPFVMPTTTSTIVTIVTPTRRLESEDSESTVTIAGIVAGVIVVIVIIVIIIGAVLFYRYRKCKTMKPTNGETEMDTLQSATYDDIDTVKMQSCPAYEVVHDNVKMQSCPAYDTIEDNTKGQVEMQSNPSYMAVR